MHSNPCSTIVVMDERGIWKPNVEISPNCPRCGCSNTKFCYYNNYSLSQPRYFCKGCRRYWTKGGSLRNVPIGGGCRKNRRAKSLRLSSSTTTTTPNLEHHHQIHNVHQAKICTGSNLGHYGLFSTNDIINPIGNNLLADGSQNSHIDLALVYANFLNQKPAFNDNNGNNGSEYDPSLELLRLRDQMTNIDQLPQENIQALFGCQSSTSLSDHHIQQNMFFCGLDDQNRADHDHFAGLPPLPVHDLMVSPDPAASMQITTHDQLLLGSDQDQNLLTTGNWSPFDFPSDHDTFSGST